MAEQTRDMGIILPAIEEAKKKKYRDNVKTVSESQFKHRLLPLAVMRYTTVDFEGEVDLTHWQTVTGVSPIYGVKVIKNGEVYFETPPLVLSPEITFEGESILERVNMVQKAERTGNTAGDVMDQSLMKPIFKTRGLSDAVHAWLLIFRLYGIHVVPSEQVNESDENQVKDADIPAPEVDSSSSDEETVSPTKVQRWVEDDDIL